MVSFDHDIPRVLLTMPTGSGKTMTATKLIKKHHERGVLSVFVVPRIELVEQTVAHLEEFNLSCTIMQGDNTRYVDDPDVIVASIQTLNRRGWPGHTLKRASCSAFLMM